MKAPALAGVAVLAVGLALAGCGADIRTTEGTPKAAAAAESPGTTTRQSPPRTTKPRVAPREENAAGPHDTIASYIDENDIEETPVKRGDPGAPMIDLPLPDGWADAGSDTPEWAYNAIVYTGPEAAEYPPSIVALLSRLDGDVDPQAILDLAGGELQNLPGYKGGNEGTFSTLGDFAAFQLGGTWVQDGLKKIVAQKTVVIDGSDGLYVLQINADGIAGQAEIVGAATGVIDAETVITP